MSNKITNLKSFVRAYGNRKSDVEISNMLDVPIDYVKSQRRDLSREHMLSKIKRHKKL